MNDKELLIEFMNCDSVSGNEGPYAELLSKHLKSMGFRVEKDRDHNVYAFDPDVETRVVFSTHIDTVPPHIPPRVDGDTVFGRGACDTKGGLVAMIKAAERLKQRGTKGLGFVLVIEEETTHRGARIAIKHPELARLKPRIILCEPTNNRVVTAQKGMLRAIVRAQGIAAHSAYPERGHSAISDLVKGLYKLESGDFPESERLGPTTCNIGMIEGGVAANVMAPAAEALLMIRLTVPVEQGKAWLEQRLEGLEIEYTACNDPVFYEVPDGYETCQVAFNTDASILSTLAPVWLVGPGDIEVAHSKNEHINMSSLRQGIDLYERLALEALGA